MKEIKKDFKYRYKNFSFEINKTTLLYEDYTSNNIYKATCKENEKTIFECDTLSKYAIIDRIKIFLYDTYRMDYTEKENLASKLNNLLY
jgi:hypothetical protein